MIEETVHTVLETRVYCKYESVLAGFLGFGRQAVCDFLKNLLNAALTMHVITS